MFQAPTFRVEYVDIPDVAKECLVSVVPMRQAAQITDWYPLLKTDAGWLEAEEMIALPGGRAYRVRLSDGSAPIINAGAEVTIW